MSSPSPETDASVRDATRDASTMDASSLKSQAHSQFIVNSSKDRDTIEYVLTEHLRMSGVYWGLTALDLIGHLDKMDTEPILKWLQRCKHPNGGY